MSTRGRVLLILTVMLALPVGLWFYGLDLAVFDGIGWFTALSLFFVAFVALPFVLASFFVGLVLWPHEQHKRRVEWKTGQKWNVD